MKKIFLFGLILLSYTAFAQYPSPIATKKNNSFIDILNGLSADSVLYFPTGCGVPTDTTFLHAQQNGGKGQKLRKWAIYGDSCGGLVYLWNPSAQSWSAIGSGGSADSTSAHAFYTKYRSDTSRVNIYAAIFGRADTTGGVIRRSDTANKWLSSIKRSGDSVYYQKGGAWVFAFLDSLGGGGIDSGLAVQYGILRSAPSGPTVYLKLDTGTVFPAIRATIPGGGGSDSGIAVRNGILATRSGSAPQRILQVDSSAYATIALLQKKIDSLNGLKDSVAFNNLITVTGGVVQGGGPAIQNTTYNFKNAYKEFHDSLSQGIYFNKVKYQPTPAASYRLAALDTADNGQMYGINLSSFDTTGQSVLLKPWLWYDRVSNTVEVSDLPVGPWVKVGNITSTQAATDTVNIDNPTYPKGVLNVQGTAQINGPVTGRYNLTITADSTISDSIQATHNASSYFRRTHKFTNVGGVAGSVNGVVMNLNDVSGADIATNSSFTFLQNSYREQVTGGGNLRSVFGLSSSVAVNGGDSLYGFHDVYMNLSSPTGILRNRFGLNMAGSGFLPNLGNVYGVFQSNLSTAGEYSAIHSTAAYGPGNFVINATGGAHSVMPWTQFDTIKIQRPVKANAIPLLMGFRKADSTLVTVTMNPANFSMSNDTVSVIGGGGGGNTNSNVGAGYRLALPNTNNIKTLFPGTNITMDSTTNASGITINSSGGSGSVSRNTRGDSIVVGSTAVIDKDNPKNSPYYLFQHMRSSIAGFATARQGTRQVHILGIGDSQFDNTQGVAQPMQNYLGGKFTWGGPGFMGVNLKNINGMSSTSYATANWTLNSSGKGLDENELNSTNTSTDLTFTQNGSTLSYNTYTKIRILWWGKTGGGTFTVSVDGGAATSIKTDSVLGAQYTEITGLPNTTHSYVVHQSTYATNGVTILGFVFLNTNNGIIFNRAAHLGTYTTDFLALDSASTVAQLKAIMPDAVWICYTNDYIGNVVDTNTYKANMQHIINRVHAANPLCDILLMSPYPVNPLYHAPTINLPSYESQIRQLAIEDTATAFYTRQVFGDWPRGFNDSLIQDTITHANISGGMAVVGAILQPFGSLTVDLGLQKTWQQIIDAESPHLAKLTSQDTVRGGPIVFDQMSDFYVKGRPSGTDRGVDIHETGTGTQLLGVNRGGTDGFSISGYNSWSFGSYIGMNANGSINHGNETLTALGTPGRIIFNNFLGGNSHNAQIYGYGADNNIEYVFAGLNGFNLAGNDGARQGSYLKFNAQTSGLAFQNWVNNAQTGADIFGFGVSRLGHLVIGGTGADNNLGNIQLNGSVWANKDSIAISTAASAVPVYQDTTSGKLVRVYPSVTSMGNLNVVSDANYTVASNVETVVYNTSITANRTVTFPSAATYPNRHIRVYFQINANNFSLILSSTSNITLAGTTSTSVSTNVVNALMDFQSDGTTWISTGFTH